MALSVDEQKRLDEIDSILATRTEDVLAPAGVDIRLNQINEELARRGEPIEPSQPDIAPEEQFKIDEEIMALANNPKTAELDPEDFVNFRRDLTTDPDIIQKDIGIERQGFVDTFKEVKEISEVAKRLPFVGSIYKASRMTELMKQVRLINSGKVGTVSFRATFAGGSSVVIGTRGATKKEKEKATKFIIEWMEDLEKAQNKTTGGKFANVLLEMPSFIVEFILTGPLFKTGSAAAKVTATKLLGKMAEKGAGKLAIRAAGAGFGSLVRTAVNVPKIVAGAAERMTAGVQITDDGAVVFADAERNPWTAVTKSFVDLYIENLSEIAGGAIGEGAVGTVKFVGKLAKKFPFINKATEELAEAWIKNAPKGITRTLSQFTSKATTKIGFNGILGEFSEERLGDIMRAATGLQEWEDVLVSKEEALIEVGVFSVFGGVNLASEKIFRKDAPTAEPITENIFRPEEGKKLNLSERLRNVPLFQSAKNRALADAEMAEATKFIKDRIGAKPKAKGGKILIPDEGEEEIKIVNAATSAKAIAGNFLEATVIKPAKALNKFAVRNIARAEDATGTWGKTGLKVQKDLREIAFRTAVNTGNTVQNIKPLTKGLSKSEKVTVAQLIDGAIQETGQPHRLVERARQIRTELDKMQKEAMGLGLRRGGLTGRAFPQVLNKKGIAEVESWEFEGPKSAKMFAAAQNMVTDGKFDTVADAVIAMQRYREGLISGKEGYIEGRRTLEIGNEFRDWNLDRILSGTIESSWEKIEAARQWGVLKDTKTDGGNLLLPFKDIQIDIAKLRLDVGKNEANALNAYLKAQYGIGTADTFIVKASRVVRTTQFVGKLAFSPLTISRNILDRYSKGLTHGTFYTNARASIQYPAFLNHWMKSARNIEDQMIRAGAVLGHGHLSEGFAGTEGFIALAAKPFASSEKGNQTYIALVKKLQLESDVKRLMELDGRDGVMSKSLDRLASIVGQSQPQVKNRILTDLTHEQLADAMAKEGQIPDDVMAEVLHRTVTDSAFPLTLASKRLWWNNKPVVQAAAQFKVWSADQTRFIYKDVIKYGAETGDWSRLGRFIVATWLVGEMYNIARDELLNKDESVLSKLQGGTRLEIIMAIMKDLVDGGVVGMISDFTYGIADWAAGPTVASVSGFAEAIDQASGTATLPEALGQALLQDIPALKQAQGLLDNLDRRFVNKNNLTDDYARWQGRSFDFRLKNGESPGDILSDRIMRMLRGVPTKRISERSLSLNMIARQVLVGDYDDAAQHIKRVISQTDIQDVKGAVQSFIQSMRNNSPFGNIAKKDLGFFITQFSAEEANKGLDLQEKWIKGYAQSLKIAFAELKAEGGIEDLKAKAEAYKAEMEPKIELAKERIKEIKAFRKERGK